MQTSHFSPFTSSGAFAVSQTTFQYKGFGSDKEDYWANRLSANLVRASVTNLRRAEASQKKWRLREGCVFHSLVAAFPMSVDDWSCDACPTIWSFSFTDLPNSP